MRFDVIKKLVVYQNKTSNFHFCKGSSMYVFVCLLFFFYLIKNMIHVYSK